MSESKAAFGFLMYGFLALLDISVLSVSEEYRNIYGTVHNLAGVAWRGGVDILLVVFYMSTYRYIHNRNPMHRLMKWHGIFYVIIGFAMCIPWGGYFFAALSPVALPYLSAMLWLPSGYFVSIVVAISFVLSNLYFARLTNEHKA